jgi:malate dehydrogenase (oxaloacetate-decarboxylating)
MKLAAAAALGDVVVDSLTPEHIVPTPFDKRVAPAVAAAVAAQARVDGVALAAPLGHDQLAGG